MTSLLIALFCWLCCSVIVWCVIRQNETDWVLHTRLRFNVGYTEGDWLIVKLLLCAGGPATIMAKLAINWIERQD